MYIDLTGNWKLVGAYMENSMSKHLTPYKNVVSILIIKIHEYFIIGLVKCDGPCIIHAWLKNNQIEVKSV